MCVYVCVRERERETEGEGERMCVCAITCWFLIACKNVFVNGEL